MLKIIFYIFIYVLLYQTAIAQVNLVPNFSFEENDSCAIGSRGIDPLCKEWFTPEIYLDPAYNPFIPNTIGSSDYFNICNQNFSVPNNIYGYQYAVTGVAYAGFAILSVRQGVSPSEIVNYKEYIEVQLNEKLIKNRNYCIEFYYCGAFFQHNYSPINVELLITDTIAKRQTDEIVNFTDIFAEAQISQSLPTNLDTVNWVKVEGSYIAKGGEQYITIGNFDDLLNINNPPSYTTAVSIYIFVDDVKLWYCDEDTSLNIDTTINHVDSMIVPNVFTPNDDGYNDVFKFKFQEQWEYETQIFNRWGHLIYDNNNSVNWDGFYKSEKVTSGVYYYVIQATAIKTGKVLVYRGIVTVLY